MRLYNYLNEVIAHEVLDRSSSKVAGLIKKCTNNIQYSTIYRGDKAFIRKDADDDRVFYFPANRAERKSINTTNHYTLLMSGLLNCGRSYPARNKSMICSADMNKARRYTAGESVLTIVPFDNTPIGVCSEGDVGDSFPMLQEHANLDGPSDLNDILNDAGISESGLASKLSMDFQEFVGRVLAIDTGTLSPRTRSDFEEYEFKKNAKFYTLKEGLEYVLDPKMNGFSITINPASLVTSSSEVGFSGSAIGYFAHGGFGV